MAEAKGKIPEKGKAPESGKGKEKAVAGWRKDLHWIVEKKLLYGLLLLLFVVYIATRMPAFGALIALAQRRPSLPIYIKLSIAS